jgi:hypothetical protein
VNLGLLARITAVADSAYLGVFDLFDEHIISAELVPDGIIEAPLPFYPVPIQGALGESCHIGNEFVASIAVDGQCCLCLWRCVGLPFSDELGSLGFGHIGGAVRALAWQSEPADNHINPMLTVGFDQRRECTLWDGQT